MINRIICLIVFLSCSLHISSQKLEEIWATEPIFDTPESVFVDRQNNCLYVSNIGGKEPWLKDGNGFISKVSMDGTVIEREWVKGLNAPKGMTLIKNKLFVADVDQLVIIDIKTGKILKTHICKDCTALNDVTDGKGKKILVTDSRGRSIYEVDGKKFVKLIDSTQLTRPNGILTSNKETYILDKEAVNRLTNGTLEMIVGGMPGGTDGIEPLSKNEFIVNCWSGTIYYVNIEQKTKVLLLDTTAKKISAADIGLNKSTKTVFVPTFFDNRVVAYKFSL
jgi:DNA-binding beta-propeller fold protein YncE